MSFFSQLQQNVITPTELSSTANINAGATFTSGSYSTLGVGGIQWNLFADQNCIVYVDQSADNSNWRWTDSFIVYANTGDGNTVQARLSYVRVRIYNNSTVATTSLQLQTALCPIVEALPGALTQLGNLKVAVREIEGDFTVKALVSPMKALKTVESTRLVGANFSGYTGTPDATYWSLAATGTGTANVANAQCTLSTGITSASTIFLNSVRTARYIGSCANYYRGIIRCPTAIGANNRKWGAFDIDNGYFFEQDSSSGLSVGSRKSTIDDKVSTGSFNGKVGTTLVLDTNVHAYEIYWTNMSAWFFYDGDLLHKFSSPIAPRIDNTHLKVGLYNANGANINDNTLEARSSTISRLGPITTQNHSRYISTLGTITVKEGPGTLSSLIPGIPGSKDVTVTLYDSLTGTGTIIYSFSIASTQISPTPLFFEHLTFSTGLTIVTSGAGTAASMTVIFE